MSAKRHVSTELNNLKTKKENFTFLQSSLCLKIEQKIEILSHLWFKQNFSKESLKHTALGIYIEFMSILLAWIMNEIVENLGQGSRESFHRFKI